MSYETAPHRMDDDEINAIIDAEITDSQTFAASAVSNARIAAMTYYLGLARGDLAPSPIPGRSQIVSTDVADTIEWMMPALMEIFTAGDDVVEFTPLKPGDEDGAQQTGDLVNHVFYEENHGWLVLYTWFKDALLQRVGVVRVCWDHAPQPMQESYRGLTDVQLTMLLQDDGVEIIEQDTRPDESALNAMRVQYEQAVQQWQQTGGEMSGQPMPPQPDPAQVPTLYDVTIVRKETAGRCVVDNVPPENFLISRNATRIGGGPCGVRDKKTISWLRQQGYDEDVIASLTSDEYGNPEMSGEAIERRLLEEAPIGASDGDGDETMREVWLTDWYTQIDVDGDGVAEWRRILRAGNGVILENDSCDGPPFASLCPVPLPHLFYGQSIADQAMPAQKLKTTIWRGLIDNMHLQINGRTWAVEDQVKLDDLLNNRPGGVIRVTQAGAVGPLQQGMTDAGSVHMLLQAADEMKQDRTGVTRYTQGSDADTLNKTAQGLENITQRADMRVKLIARIFAETGVKDLFTLIQKTLAQYQDKPKTMRLRGKWVDVDPRCWKNRYGMVVNVGLGTGDKTKQIQHLTMLGQAQQQAMAIGAATPKNIYESLKKLPPLLGFKNADEFFTDPSQQQPQEPQPDPAMAQIQAMHEAKMAEIQARAASDQHRNELEDARERDKQQRDLEFEREKLYASLAMQRELAILKLGVQQQAEQQMFNQTLESQEPYARADLNGDGRTGGYGGSAPASGAGGAYFDAPAYGGGAGFDPAGIQQGMGQQRGA